MQPENGDQPAKGPMRQDEPRRDLTLVNGSAGLGRSDTLEARSNTISPSMTLTGLLKALQRHWMLASSLGLLCAASCALAVWHFLPPAKYTARVSLHVHSFPQAVLYREMHVSSDFAAYQRTQIALVKSRRVLEAALLSNEVRELAMVRELREKRGLDEVINWLERELQVDFSGGPEILRIALSGDQPEELKTLVVAVEQAYLQKIVNSEKEEAQKHLASVEDLESNFAAKVRAGREKLAEISKLLGTNNSTAMVTIRTLSQQSLERARILLLDTQSELMKAKVEAAVMAKNAEPQVEVTLSDRAIDEYLKNDPQGKAILDLKVRIERKIKDDQGVLTGGDKNPIVVKDKQELEAVNAELAALRNRIRPQLVKDFSDKEKSEKQINQVELSKKINVLRGFEEQLQMQLENGEKNIKDIGASTLRTESFKAELAQLEETYKRVANAAQALKVERNAPDRITHLEDAYVTHPDEQKRKLVAAAGSGGAALSLVLFGIAWWEIRRQRVNSVDEVVRGLGIKLMGTVPALPSRRQLRLVNTTGRADLRWQNILTESVDTARTMLLRRATSESLRVIMVTSAVGGEGKTSLSSHLAASLARAGRITLLMDADLRNPAIHRLFGVARSPGLCELLRDEVDLANAIQPTPAPGLSLMPAGRCDELALKGLAQDKFQKICVPLRADFDFVVVDTAPVLPVADSLLVGQCVDGVIFSILHEVSRLPKVYAAHQRLEMLGMHVLGAVVSGARVDDYGSYYQYGIEVRA